MLTEKSRRIEGLLELEHLQCFFALNVRSPERFILIPCLSPLNFFTQMGSYHLFSRIFCLETIGGFYSLNSRILKISCPFYAKYTAMYGDVFTAQKIMTNGWINVVISFRKCRPFIFWVPSFQHFVYYVLDVWRFISRAGHRECFLVFFSSPIVR